MERAEANGDTADRKIDELERRVKEQDDRIEQLAPTRSASSRDPGRGGGSVGRGREASKDVRGHGGH